MPELPEVEIVCRNLNEILQPPFQIISWSFYRKDLRFAIPQMKLKKLVNQNIHRIFRRAKFIVFELDEVYFISHLGMTGSWRVEEHGWLRRKHDHLAFEFKPNVFLIYEDARRFGFIECFNKKDFEKRFTGFGAEPLSNHTNFEELTETFKKLQSPIKTALMSQKLLVGVGNIYASEILYQAHVSPLKNCSRVSKESYSLIWKWTQKILQAAIEKGGSTIDNYRDSFGNSGQFQDEFFVYGKADELCRNCDSKIKSIVQSGRTTFWCSRCQK